MFGCLGWGQTGFVEATSSSLYKGHRYPVEIIRAPPTYEAGDAGQRPATRVGTGSRYVAVRPRVRPPEVVEEERCGQA